MKYDQLTDKEKAIAAEELVTSPRGKYVIGQALAIASKALKDSEPSNSADIALIGSQYFEPFFSFNESTFITSTGILTSHGVGVPKQSE